MKLTKYFILDTNVLIHNPNALFSFTDNIVVIPLVVIEELDRFKNNPDKKGMHAREALRTIDGLIKKGALKKGARIKSGGFLQISLGPQSKVIPHLDISISDNKIIAVAWELQKKGEVVFFISKDVNARIKAEALGIKAADYEKQKVKYDSLYQGWREIAVPATEINTLYKENEIEVKGFQFHENEYVLLKANDSSKSSAICQYNSEIKGVQLLHKEYEAMGIRPLNLQQRFAFDLLLNDKVKLVTLVGQAGTGKTLIALACGMVKTIKRKPIYEKILVARPIMPLGRDIGYLPGSKNQKLNYWMQPIFDNLDFIMRNETIAGMEDNKSKSTKEKVDYLISSQIIEIEALTFIRGRSIPHQFLIVDEAQNLTPHEIKTIVSRAGEGTKIVLTGDPEQIDNPYLDANSNGLSYVVEHLKDNNIVGHIFLAKSERSDLATLAVVNL